MGMAYICVSKEACDKFFGFPDHLMVRLKRDGVIDEENVKVADAWPYFDRGDLTCNILVESDMLPGRSEGELVHKLKILTSGMDVKQWALDVRAEIMGIKVRHVPAD